jgi:UDP-glucose 4-epimerase
MVSMQITVTGGAGFIGGHLAETFAAEGHDVTVIDSFCPYYDTELKEHNVEQARAAAAESDNSYELVRGDVRDEEAIRDVVDPVYVV